MPKDEFLLPLFGEVFVSSYSTYHRLLPHLVCLTMQL